MPPALAGAIGAAYAELGGGPVAVRSSATAEDLPQAAFAGQQDTYLNVIGEPEVLDAVRRCWGSLWTERALAYRRGRGSFHSRGDTPRSPRSGSAELRIAVVVQQMVDAEFAGVMFTANPVTGAREEVVIDASPGLGEAVVSGQVTPDHYVLDARGRFRERTPGRREVVIRSLPEGGVTHTADSADDAEQLDDQVLVELARMGRSVAEHFGRPQDIEWAYAAGKLWLVQARPMTALPPPPLRLNRFERAVGLQLMDFVTVRPYPLDMSAWIKPGIGRMVERMMAEIAGLRHDFSQLLPERDGIVERFVPRLPRPTTDTFPALIRFRQRIRRYHAETWSADPRFARFEQDVDELVAVEARSVAWADLFRLARRALAAVDVVTDLRVDYLPSMVISLLKLRAVLTLLGRSDLLGVLIVGGRTRTQDANRALDQLAGQVSPDPALTAAFAELDPTALAGRIEGDDQFAGFRGALTEFLTEYGHRETASPLLVSAPTWSDDPASVLGLIKVLAEERERGKGPAPSELAERRLLEHPWLRGGRRRAAVLRLIAAARAGVAFREDSHFHATRVLPVLRRLLLEAGRRLAAAGVLASPADVFHLRLEELEAMAEPDRLPGAEADRIRALVRARADRRAELAGVPMLSAAELRPPVALHVDALLTGVAASGGQATGPVRVIREPSEFGSMRAGDVLVCPYTNPAWTPLFQRAAAVVVDSGGVGSHAAIVAREYGIPAVMGTVTGTAVLTDGRLVLVDGDAGRVTAAETED